MKTFRNHRRSRFKHNERGFKRGDNIKKFTSDFSSNHNFQRKIPGRNNHNASKLIEKYNDLAREALSKGDKILSESYFQHADHFMRILNEQANNKITEIENSDTEKKVSVTDDNTKDSQQV